MEGGLDKLGITLNLLFDLEFVFVCALRALCALCLMCLSECACVCLIMNDDEGGE